MTAVHFARDREPVLKAIRAFKGRRGDYAPTRPVEEEHLRHPRDIGAGRAGAHAVVADRSRRARTNRRRAGSRGANSA
jgi:hypothetical protein